MALGNKGLGKLSLRTPASVDSTMDFVERSRLSSENIVDLEITNDQLFALSKGETLFQFNYQDQVLSLEQEFDLSEPLTGIYLTNNTLYGSDSDGNIYEIDGSGNLSQLGSINENVQQIEVWKDWLIIKGSSNRLWTSYQNRSPELWKKSKDAGNYFTVTKNDLWLCEYNQVSRIVTSTQGASNVNSDLSQQSFTGTISFKKIPNQTIPHSKPLVFPITLEGNVPANAVQLTYESNDIKNAEVRGRSFYWEPTSGDVGSHRAKIIATANNGETDSTIVNIEVRSFNAPPRFTPIRPISIPVGEKFTLPIKAVDPDGMDQDLVRFLGVDMPDGASIDETSGTFTWTPSARQVGENQFRVIATDQFGAATSADISINVLDNVQRGNSEN